MDPTLPTNKSKQSALLKGFSTKDQTKEWSLISVAILSTGTFKLEINEILTITISAVANYSIIRNQVVNVLIPKTVLDNYKYDVQVPEQLTISVPSITKDKTLGELLQGDLAEYIKTNDIENIRVIVPEKKVQTINVNTLEIMGSDKSGSSITTNAEVDNVQVTIMDASVEMTQEADGKNKFTFYFTNIDKDSDLAVSVFGNSEPLQSDIYKEIGKSSKIFNELPKKEITDSYSLYSLLTNKTLLKDIFTYYTVHELEVSK